jgi:8-amino-7-oxononanoate synthase
VIDRPFDFAQPLQQIGRTHVVSQGRRLIYFGGCDYFRLSRHPQVLSALQKGLREFGLNPAASRFTTGNHPVYEELERELRDFFQTETATLVSTGYATNLVVAQALHAEFTHAFIDARAHHSLHDCAAYLGCPVIPFAHRSPESLGDALRKLKQPRPLLLTDGLFSHNGTVAPLKEYLAVLPETASILVDDAHGAGILGRHGRGSCEAIRISPERMIQTISLSKAFGTSGGAVLASAAMRKKMLERSRLLQGNTPLPLPLASAARCSVTILRDNVALRIKLQKNIQSLRRQLRTLASSEPPAPIFAFQPRTVRAGQRLKEKLLAAGIHPPEIAYGTIHPYFRFALSSEHLPGQIAALAQLLRSSKKQAVPESGRTRG